VVNSKDNLNFEEEKMMWICGEGEERIKIE
jgi:hypothetical protein